MKRIALFPLVLITIFSRSTFTQAATLISLAPRSGTAQGIEVNLLKSFDRIGKTLPPWLTDVTFSRYPLHLSLGYIDASEWEQNEPKLTLIIGDAIKEFLKKNENLFFTVDHLEVLGQQGSEFVVMYPNDETASKLKELNRWVHVKLVGDGFGGFIMNGHPDQFLPHLSVIKKGVLKSLALNNWQTRGFDPIPDFDHVLSLFFQSVLEINRTQGGYTFKFEKVGSNTHHSLKTILHWGDIVPHATSSISAIQSNL